MKNLLCTIGLQSMPDFFFVAYFMNADKSSSCDSRELDFY